MVSGLGAVESRESEIVSSGGGCWSIWVISREIRKRRKKEKKGEIRK